MRYCIVVPALFFFTVFFSCKVGKKGPAEGALFVTDKKPSELKKDDAKYLKKLNKRLKKEDRRLRRERRKK